MRSLRRSLPSSLSNGSIMRQANIRDARVEHAHVTGMCSKAELTAELRHNDAASLSLRPRAHLPPLAFRNGTREDRE